MTLQRPGAPLLSLLLLFAGACAGPPDPARAGPGYVELYAGGKYTEALQQAAARAKALPAGAEREQALLVAGESAHALDKDAEAEVHLRPLLDSRNPAVAGRAAAVLGLIQQEAGMHNRAIDLFEKAQGSLTGDDAARACIHAGDSYRALDKLTEARLAYDKAGTLASADPNLRSMINDRRSGRPATITPGVQKTGGYTLQLGAFSALQRAQATADRFRPRTEATGLGPPRIIETVLKGKRAYLVQAGRFPSKGAAESARAKLGPDLFVTMADD